MHIYQLVKEPLSYLVGHSYPAIHFPFPIFYLLALGTYPAGHCSPLGAYPVVPFFPLGSFPASRCFPYGAFLLICCLPLGARLAPGAFLLFLLQSLLLLILS